MIRYGTIILLSLVVSLSFFAKGCPQSKLDKQKAAVYDIQKAIDTFKDSIPSLQTAGLAQTDLNELVRHVKEINTLNNELIDLAWTDPNATSSKVDALKAAITSLVNSNVVIKNKNSQAAINALVTALLNDYKVLKGT